MCIKYGIKINRSGCDPSLLSEDGDTWYNYGTSGRMLFETATEAVMFMITNKNMTEWRLNGVIYEVARYEKD